MRQFFAIVFCFLTLFSWACCLLWPSMTQKLSEEKQLSQFYSLIQGNKLAKSSLIYRELTIFAPTNEAFEKFNGSLTENLVLYHMVPLARTLDNLNELTLVPCLEEHPPLWINTNGNTTFVNNAKILTNFSEYVIKSRADQYGKVQVLHIIDEVLSPMASTTTSPTAFDFLSQPNMWKLIPYTYNTFYKRVILSRMMNVFKGDQKGTFFVPVDQLMPRNMEALIDKDVIEAGIIPNKIVFTRSALEGFIYTTRGLEKDFYNIIEFINEDHVKVSKISKLSKVDEKIIKILEPNIPVKNGVVHVVRDVLGVFQRKLTKFPYLEVLNKIQTDLNVNTSNALFEKTDLIQLLDDAYTNYTIFLPTDFAWKKLATAKSFNVSEFASHEFLRRAKNIMRRHIVVGEYYNLRRLLDVSKNFRGKEIFLNVGSEDILIKVVERDGDYYIHWGLKQIKITRPDYECSNGIIHLVDAPFVFDSELKGVGSIAEHSSLLYKAWDVLKKVGLNFS